jgi:vitamin B12 transporter
VRKIAPVLFTLLILAPAGADVGLVIIREIQPVSGTDWLVLETGDIAASGATTLGELLADVPGFFINDSGTPGGLVTASVRGAAANQVLVLVDGVPLNQATTGVADLSTVPLSELERIEIRRGVASSHYGGGAVGGVVNLVTKTATEANGALSVAVGSVGERRYSLALGGGVGSELTLSARGWLAEHDGWRENSAVEEKGLRAAASLDLRGHTLRADYTLTAKDQGLPGPRPPEGETPEFGSGDVTSLFDSQGDTAQSVTLNYHGRIGTVTLHADLGWRDSGLDYFTRYRSYYVTEEDYSYRTSDYYGSVWSRFIPFEPVELEVGADYRASRLEARVDSTVWSGGSSRPDDPGVTTATEWSPEVDDLGVWLEARAELGAVSADAGVRADYHDAFGTRVTGDAGLDAVLDTLRLRVSGGTAFRAPTLNDLYWPTGGNPDLRPEEAWEAGGGFDWEPEDAPALTGNLFYRETTDLVSWQPDETGLWWSPQNVDSQTVLGADLRVSFWSLSAAYTFTDATQRQREVVYSDWMTGEVRTATVERRAAYLPRHQLTLGYDAGLVKLTARWTGDRVAYYPDYSDPPRVTMTEKVIPSVWSFDVRAEYELARGFRFFAAVENLTDADAPAAFGNTADDRDYPRAPRRFTLGAEMVF